MNFIRTIKLKRLNGNFDDLNEKESLFISLFNNLVKCDNFYWYSKDSDIYYFEYHPIHKSFWCSHNHVWSIFERRYNMKYFEIKNLINDILEKRFGLKDVKIYTSTNR